MPERMVALGWTRPAVARHAEIGACLQCARGQLAARTAGALSKFAHIGGNIHYQPVPEAGAGRRVGVIAGHCKAVCALWRARPLQMRRPVTSGAAKAKIGRENEI